ncbi:ATPase AAA [Bombiscardovia apis]|uniref:ATPase AAA n=1 Tax=Bombiscardovia apis TaxID=2932182 RepID=A0ABN6SG79_9BIFI|nr:fibronectin type III domain-containing protein [Bombiscardovia apis]BDR54277.1 ATPase AAA [Bombiscardovia apis]
MSTIRGNRRKQNQHYQTKNSAISASKLSSWAQLGLAVLAVIGVSIAAIVVRTVSQERTIVDDGTVWVASASERKLARFNPRISETDAVIPAPAQTSELDLTQSGNTTLMKTGRTLTSIDPTLLSPAQSIETPEGLQALIGGESLALFDRHSGRVWTRSSTAPLPNLQAEEPSLRLGQGGAIGVDTGGILYGFRSHDGSVIRMDRPQGKAFQTLDSITGGHPLRADALAIVGSRVLVLSDRTLYWDAGKLTLPGKGSLRLQASPVDSLQSETWAAVAHEGGLYLINLDRPTDEPQSIVSGGSGKPAQPVSSGGCWWAAWASTARNFTRLCTADQEESPKPQAKQGGKALPQAEQAGLDSRVQTLGSISPESQLVFRTNKRQVVLNDVTVGSMWNPLKSTHAIGMSWQQSSVRPASERTSNSRADNGGQLMRDCAKQTGEIEAQDDEFSMRAGSRAILAPLANDAQSGCLISSLTQVSSSNKRLGLTPVADNRKLQVDASQVEEGSVRISYSISDGRGKSSTASISLTLLDKSSNQPPALLQQQRPCELEAGGSADFNALEGFVDPDSDPLFLTGARSLGGEAVSLSAREDGKLRLHANESASGQVPIEATASDGQAQASSIVNCTIAPAHTLPAQADPLIRSMQVGQPLNIDLSSAIHGSSDAAVKLLEVPSPPELSITTDSDRLSLKVEARSVGTYYLPYRIAQAEQESQGLLRLQVSKPARNSAKPITADDTAVFNSAGQARIDPLANDSNPQGGPLALSSWSAEGAQPVRAIIVDHRFLQVQAPQSLNRPIALSYEASNSAGSSKGQIRILPPIQSASKPGLSAPNLQAEVKAGSKVSIPILSRISSERGDRLKLSPKLEPQPGSLSNFAFISGSSVRYWAGNEPGQARLLYRISDSQGQSATGVITVQVNASQAASSQPLALSPVESQTVAGAQTKVAIDIQTPEMQGEEWRLAGIGSQFPQLGRIRQVGPNFLQYEAYSNDHGIDDFTYLLRGKHGQQAEGQIRMAVTAGQAGSNLMARDDDIQLRPNTPVSVPVLANDVSENGQNLTLDHKLELNGVDKVNVSDHAISLTSPASAGSSFIRYRARNESGATSQANLRIVTNPQAEIEPPMAADYWLTPAQAQGRQQVSIDLAPAIGNPSGPASDLQLGLNPTASAPQGQPTGPVGSSRLTLELGEQPRTVAYTVSNTRHGLTSTACVYLPAQGDFPPSLKEGVTPLKVQTGVRTLIPISDYLTVRPGSSASILSAQAVHANKADGSETYIDTHTLAFTSATNYAGPAAISFTATDSDTDHSPAHTAVVTIPIEVSDGKPPAPVFTPPVLDVEAGAPEQEISLRPFLSTHSAEQARKLSFSSHNLSKPLSASLNQQGILKLHAAASSSIGSSASLPLRITYPGGQIQATLTLRIIASRRPLAQIPERRLSLAAGSSRRINALEGAFNPFPNQALRVSSVVSTSPGLSASIQSEGWVQIRSDAVGDAVSGQLVLAIADASGAKEREVRTSILVDFINYPLPPSLIASSLQAGDGQVSVSWQPSAPRGSAITLYQLVSISNHGQVSQDCDQATSCTLHGLSNGSDYSLRVRARNAVGWSEFSAPLAARPDTKPAPPSNLRIDGSKQETLHIAWDPPANSGSRIAGYTLEASGPGCGSSRGRTPQSTQATLTVPHSSAGQICTVSVSAVNQAGQGPPASAIGSTWSSPDAPVFESITQKPGSKQPARIEVRLRPGSLHGHPCSAVDLRLADVSGEQFATSFPCNQSGASVSGELTIPQQFAGRSLTFEAVTRAQGPADSNTSATARAVYTLERISEHERSR